MHFSDTSSKDEPGDNTDVLMADATLIHGHNKKKLPRFKCSTRKKKGFKVSGI
jgi:hypothetical protein